MSRILFVSAALLGLAGCASADPYARQGYQASSDQSRHGDKSLGYDDGMERPPAWQRLRSKEWSGENSTVPSDAFSFLQALNLPPSHWEVHSGQ